jgi:surface protein
MYLIRSGKDVTKVNTSKITDMNCMFREYRSFNQDISKWNVSNVTDMRNMFFNAKSFKTLF